MARERATGKVTEIRRDATIDVARGFAIISIVLCHVLRGLDAAHMLGNGGWIVTTDRVLALWQISVFAFLGGVFVRNSVMKRSMRTYVAERTFRLLAIYLTWTAIEGSVLLLATGAVNHSKSLSSVLRVWIPLGQLWYLPFVAALTLVVVPLRPWEPKRAPWLLGLSAVPSIAAWGLNGPVIATQGLGLVVFFVGGILVGINRLQSALQSVTSVVAGLGGAGLFALGTVVAVSMAPTPPTTLGAGRTACTVALGVAVCLLMSTGALFLARAARSWGFFATCGRRSMEIYLAHIILASGSRIILARLGVHSVSLLVCVGLFAGVVGSLVAATATRKAGLAWVFDGPQPPDLKGFNFTRLQKAE